MELSQQKIYSKIVELSNQRKESKNFDVKEFQKFAKDFYARNSGIKFENYNSDEFYHAALLSFDFLSQRKSGESKIRISNPKLGEKGVENFNSHHTFIDIINDDAPFLIDSIVAFLDKLDLRILNIVHPIYSVVRDKNGKLASITDDKSAKKESVIQIHLDRITSVNVIDSLYKEIAKILENVSLVVGDWKSMVDMSFKAQAGLDNAKKLRNSKEITEIKDFISWINDGNFIFLGAKEFDVEKVGKKNEYQLKEVRNSSFGVFKSLYEEFRPQVANTSFEEVTDSVVNPFVIEILKSRYRSRIHRNSNAERIRVQKISADGKVVGEYRFVGLFTSSAYNQTPHFIPLVKGKIAQVVDESGFTKGSHDYKELMSVLESYPRDELFQITPKDLLRISTGVVGICGRSQVKFFARNDKFNRFVSCLVFMPRERSNSDVREKLKSYLASAYNGVVSDSFMQISESKLVRFHVIIRTEKAIPKISEETIENEVNKITKIWKDDFREVVNARFDSGNQEYIYNKYKDAFSVSYVNKFSARRASIDASMIEECLKKKHILFYLYKSEKFETDNLSELKIYNLGKELVLSDIMPVLESFGFAIVKEYTYEVNPLNGEKVYVHYFNLHLSKYKNKNVFSAKIKGNFEKLVTLINKGLAEYGPLNRLVVELELNWKFICMIAAYTKYLYQAGFRYSQAYIADVLSKNPEITKLLTELFENKFDPGLEHSIEDRRKIAREIESKIEAELSKVTDIASDTVIKRLLNIINATLRTNFYQVIEDHEHNGSSYKGYISFKFECSKILNLPLPLPYAEVFVYSSRVEGVHLRGGKVARGGLRWSDRHEDFRTEVLGLMKAQMTKNAVIVPVGSKGGFVVKKSTQGMSREEVLAEGIECYKTFLRGILDVTDNVIAGKIKNASCVAFDDVDPYLVVAADKGTATFSDIANSISAEYNFWLGDAFASGGSVGYDHKKMGITAKGGWVSVRRHFQEMGRDTQSEDFTCVGIGDLSGDVFGNGMLLSKHIKMVAAFNHMHIFLDPNPNPEKSFKERVRMFNLPRSSWMDYDKSLISQGGGIFERTAKSIKISKQVKEVLGISEDELAPKDLMRAILKAPVDLLWNGGIGTYVKAQDETNQEVGDRANDELRIDGADLRCKVVGEGGNLGFTQKGRIEYALKGGRVNTDAMDNSAGVDCSDHEVNIKIALIQALLSKKITLEQRNKILESMTDEVSHLVLEDNRLQTQAISTISSQAALTLSDQSQFLDRLEKSGLLNRRIEFLPSQKEIEARQVNSVGLTRPELCVMLAYSKMDIYNKLVNSDLVKDEYFSHELFSYFPTTMQEKFAHEIKHHQLRKEIIATQITNFIVNRTGITLVGQICQDNGFEIEDVIKCMIIAIDSFRLRDVWKEIESLDGKVSYETQSQMFLNSNKLLERSVTWLLKNPSKVKGSITKNVERFRKIADSLSSVLASVLAQASKESFERKVEKYCLNKVERKLAIKVAGMDPLASTFDIAEISAESHFDIETIAKIYFTVGTRFSLKWLRSKVSKLAYDNKWQRLSGKTILEDLYSYQMRIAKAVVDFNCNDKKICEINSTEKWVETVDVMVKRFDDFIDDLKMNPNPDIAVFIVALNRLKPLV
ncbi:MAG: NAD-glutamate dehydrogenase [Rickettsiales bacterium]|nr:NAD-glutamate dehydrogenase [Rickettsiales bacterium]